MVAFLSEGFGLRNYAECPTPSGRFVAASGGSLAVADLALGGASGLFAGVEAEGAGFRAGRVGLNVAPGGPLPAGLPPASAWSLFQSAFPFGFALLTRPVRKTGRFSFSGDPRQRIHFPERRLPAIPLAVLRKACRVKRVPRGVEARAGYRRKMGLLLEKVCGSLRQDWCVLLRTREAVERCVPPAKLEDLLKGSDERCRERQAERFLTEAWLALRFGSNRQVRARLANAPGDQSVVPEGLQALAAQICVSASWSAPRRSEADWFLEGVMRLDPGDGGRWSPDGLRRLFAARGEIQAGRVVEAIRECLVFTEETDKSDPLHSVGLERMADGFQRMGDEARELVAPRVRRKEARQWLWQLRLQQRVKSR